MIVYPLASNLSFEVKSSTITIIEMVSKLSKMNMPGCNFQHISCHIKNGNSTRNIVCPRHTQFESDYFSEIPRKGFLTFHMSEHRVMHFPACL